MSGKYNRMSMQYISMSPVKNPFTMLKNTLSMIFHLFTIINSSPKLHNPPFSIPLILIMALDIPLKIINPLTTIANFRSSIKQI